MNKDELRILFKNKRSALDASNIMKYEDLMLINFQQLEIDIPDRIMSYAVFEKMNEFDPLLITDYCYFKNPVMELLYPVIDAKTNSMKSVLVNDETIFEPNKFGIPEPTDCMTVVPEEIDLIIVPLLAYDVKGHRVGYGKGYYDRFLKQCKDDVVKIGFSFFEPVECIRDSARHDVKLDYCISPERIYRF